MSRWLKFGLLVLTLSFLNMMLHWDVYSSRFRHVRRSEVQFVDLAFVLQEYWGDQMLLLDVRTEKEFMAEHIKGALHLNLDEKSKLPARKMLVVYCRDSLCGAAYTAARDVSQSLNQKIYVYSGGMREWRNARLPLFHKGDAP